MATPPTRENVLEHSNLSSDASYTSGFIDNILIPLIDFLIPFSLSKTKEEKEVGQWDESDTHYNSRLEDDDSSSDCQSYPSSPLPSEPYSRVRTHRLQKSSHKLPSSASTSLSTLSSYYMSASSLSSSLSSSCSLSHAVPIKSSSARGSNAKEGDDGDYGFFADFEDPITDEVLIRNTPPKGVFSIGEDAQEEES